MLDNELTITQYYNNLGLSHDIIPNAFIIEPNETNFYSVFYENNTLIKLTNNGLTTEDTTAFIDLIGTVKKIKINIGFYIDSKDNYSTNDYSEYNFFKIRNNIQIITLEGLVNDNNVNNKIEYKFINK
jgi:hypothetical protein